MGELFTRTFDTSDFPARWHCGTWTDSHGWTHIVADVLIAAAYFTIPITLLYFARKRHDLPFLPIFWWFAAFISTCGLVHLAEAVIFWHPWYRFSALLKVTTAMASWGTVAMLIPMIPKALNLPGLAAMNEQLRTEIEHREKTEADLQTALDRLQASEDRFRAAIEAAPIAMIMVDSRGEIVLANAHSEALFGYPRDEFLGLSVDELVPDDARGAHASMRDSYLTNPVARRMGPNRSLTAKRKDGTEFPAEIGLNPVVTDDSIYVISAVHDITDRLESERRVRESQQRLELALVNANIGLWDLNIKTGELHVSPTYNTQVGYPADATWRDIDAVKAMVHPDDVEEKDRVLDACLSGGASDCVSTYRFRRPDGSYSWVLSRAGVVHDPSGEQRLIGVHVDINESQRLIDQLRQANEELESVAYIASHDLKAPLRAIDQIASWLAEDLEGSLPESSENHLQALKQRVGRMERLLTDLLEYARAGSMGDTITEINLPELTDRVVDLASLPEGFTVKRDLEVAAIEGRATPLETALRNLVGNAFKHHDRSSGTIEISCRPSRLRADQVVFEVSDDGPGIPPEHRERAQQMFQTLKPRDEVEGSGMGLALVKKIVESSGGRLSIKENHPRGAVARFTWPSRVNETPKRH